MVYTVLAMENMIDVTLAGLTFPCRLRYPETARYFPKPDPAATRVGGDPVCLSDEDWQYFLNTGMEDCAHTEFSILTAFFSDALMAHDGMIIHAVALRWRDRAYLICAPSGVGKSTQTKTLQALRPGEFTVICGDRPALQFCQCAPVGRPDPRPPQDTSPIGEAYRGGGPAQPVEGSILVHPSHWNGKENWYGAEAAPLAGVILLQRGEENALAALSPREAALRAYAQVIQACADSEKMRKAADLTTKLLNSVPIWQLTSYQVPDSTKLLLETVFV